MPIVDNQYLIETCLLCQSGHCIVRLKPLSAGEQVLTVNGEGMCSVIPLNILVIIKNMMEGELQV